MGRPDSSRTAGSPGLDIFAQQDGTKAVATLREAVKFEQAHATYYPDVLPRPSAEMLGDLLLSLAPEIAVCQWSNLLLRQL